MRKIYMFLAIAVLAACQLQAQPTRCPASGEPIEVQQPDGSFITVVGLGNIDINYTETTDGYTIVRNQDGIYEYAVRNAEGDLVPSGVRANDPDTRVSTEKKY